MRSNVTPILAGALVASIGWVGPAVCQAGMHERSGGGSRPPLTEEQVAFLELARQETAAYQDLSVAIADGFRPIGADAPAMGRHWVHPGRLLDDAIDAARPEILSYVVIGERSVLVGVGFANVVRPDDGAAPRHNPFSPGAWHVHAGALDRESRLVDHAGGTEAEVTLHGVSVLHAWVWADNPEGALEPNNWTLPYVRLGISRPRGATPDVDRAVSLASMGSDFFAERLERFGEHDPEAEAAALGELSAVAESIGAWWDRRPFGPLSDGEVAWLADQWKRLERYAF